ncbi:MAG: hypothetical protein PHP18_05700 [Bacilli bacterium]|nr:hypothetical protein [Bacilli bacterium]
MLCTICGSDKFSRSTVPLNKRIIIVTLTCKKCNSKHQYQVKDLGVFINDRNNLSA